MSFGTVKTGEEFIDIAVDELFSRGGMAVCLRHNHRSQLSSGPVGKYLDEIEPDFPTSEIANNTLRAEWQAAAFNATRIGDTVAGAFIFAQLYKHFNALYPQTDPVLARIGNKETYKVEAYISRSFVANLDGHVFTAACGASKERIYYNEEIPTLIETIPALIDSLLKAEDIKTVNGVAIEKYRKLFAHKGYDAVYQYLCLNEQRLLLHYARATGSQAAFRDYLTRKELYQLERKDTFTKNGASTSYMATDGTLRTVLKHERPVYNRTKRERWHRRMMALLNWTITHGQPVVKDPSYTNPLYRPRPWAYSARLKNVGLVA
jgi:hypothetical protein